VVKKHIFLQIFASLAIVACVAPCQRLSEATACNLAQAWAKEHRVFRNIQKGSCSYFSQRGDEAFICVDGITSTSRSTPKRAGRHWTELWLRTVVAPAGSSLWAGYRQAHSQTMPLQTDCGGEQSRLGGAAPFRPRRVSARTLGGNGRERISNVNAAYSDGARLPRRSDTLGCNRRGRCGGLARSAARTGACSERRRRRTPVGPLSRILSGRLSDRGASRRPGSTQR
jgi:hypothetical protein